MNFHGKDWRGYSLNSNVIKGLIHADKHHGRILAVGIEVAVFDNLTPKEKCSFFYEENF
ncbi:hypothetical protein [Lactobacillus sp. HT06-2]|uniref:hypothetical protein n=1 Tax=Lactobacillus sp. HT06-2 TaxID=2080222 RepID=UPI001F185097|nr:hypothetical protein [Lactobacillus sp. HT06-2]